MADRSQNGYLVLDYEDTKVWTIPRSTTPVKVRLAPGPIGFVLVHFAAYFDHQIEDIDEGKDDWGYNKRPITGTVNEWSNHASGTALDLNSLKHPYGQRDTFDDYHQALMLDRIEGVYLGCIRPGFTYRRIPDDMHFELVKPRRYVVDVAENLYDSFYGRRIRAANPWLNWKP